jgi:hypothetical protein
MRIFIAIIMTLSLLSFSVSAEEYKSAQRFKDGDVISASVLNDILDRIELSLKPITREEMIGTWTITQYWCGNSSPNPNVDPTAIGTYGCNNNGVNGNMLSGLTKEGSGLAATRSDTLTITEIDGDSYRFKVQSSNYNMFYNDGIGSNQYLSDSASHECAFIGGSAMFGCELDSKINNGSSPPRALAAYFNVERRSHTRVKLYWGADRSGGLFNILILDKKSVPPVAPTALVAELSTYSISLSWTKGDDTATSYDVQRKTTFDGTFASLGTTTTTSDSDTDVTANADYWYRVFAKNDNGTSIGSNVVKLTYVTSTAPAAATSLAATVGTGFVSLTWTAGDDTATSYEIKRKTGTDGTYSVLGTTSTTTSFSDTTGLTDGTSYSYQVFAKNANGTATGSNVVTVTYE